MKSLLRSVFASFLAVFARAILRRYKPLIVMVTGSVGKTSTKDAVAAVLAEKYHLRASEKSYNSEFGVPLTIIGAKNPWHDPFQWLRVFEEALALIFLPSHYPKLLVLEVGADRPGDLARILRIATPNIVVVTRLPDVPVHVEAYASPKAVREEEFQPAYALAPSAPLILCADDANAMAMAKQLPVEMHTFGVSASADVRLNDVQISFDKKRPTGMRARVMIEGKEHPLSAVGALGAQQLLAPGAAVAVGRALGMHVSDILHGLTHYVPPPGRARILAGKGGSVLIDDSYNSSPAAVEEALASLVLIPTTRRIAVLGDMLELGRYSAEEHERIGALAATRADVVIGVGSRARVIAQAAQTAGLPTEQVFCFDTSLDAAARLQELVGEGDVVLIKGSQSIRMERIVEALLLNPSDVNQLVRQDTEWKKR